VANSHSATIPFWGFWAGVPFLGWLRGFLVGVSGGQGNGGCAPGGRRQKVAVY